MEKRELQQYRALLAEACLLEEEKRRLADGMLAAVRITGLPKGNGTADDTGRLAAKLADLSVLLAEKLEAAIDARLRMEEAIENLEAQERVLMRLRYIEGLTWERIAEEMHYSYQWVCTLHERILQKMKKS